MTIKEKLSKANLRIKELVKRIESLEEKIEKLNLERAAIGRQEIDRFLKEDCEDELQAISHGLKRDWKTKLDEHLRLP